MGQMLKKRNEIKEEYKWAMEDLYANDAAWQEDYQRLEKMSEKLGSFKGHIGENKETLLKLLKTVDEISKLHEKVYVYAGQKLHEDTSNSHYQELSGRISSLSVKLGKEEAYIVPEFLKMDEEVITKYLKEEPELKIYEQYFHNLFREKIHTLSEKEEEIMAAAGEVASGANDIFQMFNNADLKFADAVDAQGEKHKLTHGTYVAYLRSSDRVLREDAFKKVHGAYQAYENTLAATYTANLKKDTFYAKVRKYGSTLEMALSGSNIPLSVYDNLIAAVEERLPVLHRYVQLRKKMLGVDKLHMYDLYVPMIADVEKKIPFSEAKEIVFKALQPMGEQYLARLKEGFDNRWIDIYENEGKRSGAYSWGAYGTHPYVLLNYQENLNHVFTLAHEMGHALHSYYSDEAQPYIYASYKIFVAEVASTCNENLLIHYLLENSKQTSEKAYLLNYLLEQFRGTVFRQTMFAEFEKITHRKVEKGETLTAESLREIYYELNKKYYGEEIEVDAEIAMEWARIPHFYRSFYVYQYATGFSAAIALSNNILSGDAAALSSYLTFLSGGSSDYPIELLKKAGVDMTKKESIAAALDVFENRLKELESLK